MKRGLTVAVLAALALPVLALAAMIGEQEIRVAGARILNVPVRGVDPRDLLQGHYLTATYDWDWQPEPTASGAGGLCVLSASNGQKPQVHVMEDWKPSDGAIDGCLMMIAGKVRAKSDGQPAAFVPTGLDAGYFTVHLFVAESRAASLEELIRKRPGTLSVDLAVRADGRAVVRHLRLDGEILDR